jgi:hypothetical protein
MIATNNAEELYELIMKCSAVHHCVGEEWREGVPRIATLSASFLRYEKTKKGAWKACATVELLGHFDKDALTRSSKSNWSS